MPSSETNNALHRASPFVALRGVLAVAASAAVLTRPAMSRGLLLAIVGGYLFIDGLLALGTALRAERGSWGRGPYLLEGLISMTIGALAFARPMSIAAAVWTLIAGRAVITGLVEIAAAASLRTGGGEHHWPIGMSGLVSLGFGAFLLARPASGPFLVLLLAGFTILVFGLGMIGAAFRLHRASSRLRGRAPA